MQRGQWRRHRVTTLRFVRGSEKLIGGHNGHGYHHTIDSWWKRKPFRVLGRLIDREAGAGVTEKIVRVSEDSPRFVLYGKATPSIGFAKVVTAIRHGLIL